MLEFTRGLDALVASEFDALDTAVAMLSFRGSENIFSYGLLQNVLQKRKYGEKAEEKIELVNAVLGKGVQAFILLCRALREKHYDDSASLIEAGITETLVRSTAEDSESAVKSALHYHEYLKQFQADQLSNFFERLLENKTLFAGVMAKPGARAASSPLTINVYGNVPFYPRYQDCRYNDDKEKIEKACEEMFEQDRGAMLVKGEGAIGKSLIVAHSFVRNKAFLKQFSIGNVYWLNTWAYSNDDSDNIDQIFERLGEMSHSASGNDENSETTFISKLEATSSPHCRTLIVLDDVYKPSIYDQASNLADHVYMIAISRDQNVNEENLFVEMSPVGDEFFSCLFSPFEPLLPPDDMQKLVKACAGLPLIGQLVAAQLRKYNTKITASNICSKILRRRKIEISGDWDLNRNLDKIYQLFLIGLDDDPEMQHRFLAFLLYPKGSSVPLSELAVLWQLPEEDAAEEAVELQSRSWARADDENIETLSIHDYLYEVALEFAFETLESANRNLLGMRRALLRQYGDVVLVEAVRLGSYDLVNNVVSVLLSTSGQRQDIEKTLFDICSQSSTLTAFFEYQVLRFPGQPYQSNFSITNACQILQRMLVLDKTRAMAVIKSEGILPKLKATIVNGRKATENALFVSLRCERLLDLLVANDADLLVIDDEGNTVIMHAASRNADMALEKLLPRCGDLVNNVNADGNSAMHLACRYGDEDTAMTLLKANNLKLDLRNKTNETAIEMAMEREDMKDVCRQMREMYPDVPNDGSKIHANLNWPPLATAVYERNFGHVEKLLGKGVDFSFRVDGLLGTAWRTQISLLHLAAWQGDVRMAKILTDNGLQVDCVMDDQNTPLWIAAQNGHHDIVQFLAGKGADIDARTDDQATPFYVAAQNGHQKVVEFLARKGADINARRVDQATPLHIAAQTGQQQIVEFLAGKGASVNVRTNEQTTPLFLAAQNGHQQIVEFLVDAGAETDSGRDDKSTPLYVAAQNGHQNIVKYLVGKSGKSNVTALGIAAFNGHHHIVELLTANNADIIAQADDRGSPLYYAAQNGHQGIVELLARNGADIDARSKSLVTPLYIAAQNGHQGIVELLAGMGADIEARTKNLDTPLYIAAQNGHLKIVEFLVGRCANIDVQNEDQVTPLYTAAQNGHQEIVKFLVGKGAQIDLRNDEQTTPLRIAAQNGHLEIATFLVAKGADIDARTDDQTTTLYAVAQAGHLQVAVFLAGKGAEIDARTEDQTTPLYVAAQNGYPRIVELLARNGADIDARSDELATPLYIAAQNGHQQIVEFLVGKGADIEARTDYEVSPLYIAAQEGHQQIVEFLADKGADINAHMYMQETPLYVAAEAGHHQIVEFLVGRGANIDARADNQVSPLYIAAQNGHAEVIECLLKNGADQNIRSAYGTPIMAAERSGHDDIVSLLADNSSMGPSCAKNFKYK